MLYPSVSTVHPTNFTKRGKTYFSQIKLVVLLSCCFSLTITVLAQVFIQRNLYFPFSFEKIFFPLARNPFFFFLVLSIGLAEPIDELEDLRLELYRQENNQIKTWIKKQVKRGAVTSRGGIGLHCFNSSRPLCSEGQYEYFRATLLGILILRVSCFKLYSFP